MTGKLSDICGLFFSSILISDLSFSLYFFHKKKLISPTLIRESFLFISILVGISFFLLQTNSTFLALYKNIYAFFGFKIKIWQDTNDLWALLSIIFSYYYFQYVNRENFYGRNHV